mgnify:CR=1 FL=1
MKITKELINVKFQLNNIKGKNSLARVDFFCKPLKNHRF